MMDHEKIARERIAGGRIMFWTWAIVIAVGALTVVLYGGK